MRIAIAGFQHETNTFAPSKATYADFERGGGWPALQRDSSGNRNTTGMLCSLIAEETLIAKAPGPMIADPSEFPWKRLAPGIRLKPNGPVFR